MASVRERFEGSNSNSNERIGRGENTSFLGLSSRDGLVTVTSQIDNGRGFRWKAHCSAPTCNCDFVVEHAYLVNGGELRCVASGHSATLTSSSRSSDARVDIQPRADITASPRERQMAAARDVEIAQIGDSDATN